MSEGQVFIEQSLDELVGAAHELKTPLAIIAHLVAAIEDESLGLTEAERKTALQRIRLSTDRLLKLVQGLTTSYRLSQTNQLAFQFELEPLSISQICEEVAHEITPLAQEYKQSVVLKQQKSQLIVGNDSLVRSILFNLLDNAIRHSTPKNTVTMQIQRRQQLIRVGVQDNGFGLNRSELKTLQQRMGKQTQPIIGRASSSGLGLYISQTMAQAMGGGIGVAATKVGTTFHVEFQHSAQLSFL